MEMSNETKVNNNAKSINGLTVSSRQLKAKGEIKVSNRFESGWNNKTEYIGL